MSSTKKILSEMAISRAKFKEKLTEKLMGLVREYSFNLYAKANHQTKWVKHKESEIERLELEMEDILDLETTSQFDRMKAFKEAISEVKTDKALNRGVNQYERYYKIAPQIKIDQQTLDHYLIHLTDLAKKRLKQLKEECDRFGIPINELFESR